MDLNTTSSSEIMLAYLRSPKDFPRDNLERIMRQKVLILRGNIHNTLVGRTDPSAKLAFLLLDQSFKGKTYLRKLLKEAHVLEKIANILQSDNLNSTTELM